jgi:hypothetical protein
MSRHIYLRIGVGDSIEPENLVKSLSHSYAIFRELGASITGDPKGGINWGIDAITKASPLEVAFSGEARKIDFVNPLEHVQSALISGLKSLSVDTEEPKRPQFYSDKALRAVQKLADLNKRRSIGDIELYTSLNERAPITTTISRSVGFLIDAAFESEGSIVGNLDSITVHRSHEFRVWDEFSGCAVTCKFRRDMLDEVKGGLKRRVLVHGTIKRNIHSLPVNIMVSGIEAQLTESQLPTIEEMSGLVDDITAGSTLREHLEDLRGG